MPPIRKHPRHSRDGALAADDHTMPCDQRADRGSCTEPGDFIDQTIAIWQTRTERRLTREDGREIIENITGFFTILDEWERKERIGKSAKPALSPPGSGLGRRTRRTR
jgi:hypothetical protein